MIPHPYCTRIVFCRIKLPERAPGKSRTCVSRIKSPVRLPLRYESLVDREGYDPSTSPCKGDVFPTKLAALNELTCGSLDKLFLSYLN